MKAIDNDAFESALEVIQEVNKPFVLTSGNVLNTLMSAMNKDDSEMTPFEITVIATYLYYLGGGSKKVSR